MNTDIDAEQAPEKAQGQDKWESVAAVQGQKKDRRQPMQIKDRPLCADTYRRRSGVCKIISAVVS